jgi:hypothetical protein
MLSSIIDYTFCEFSDLVYASFASISNSADSAKYINPSALRVRVEVALGPAL